MSIPLNRNRVHGTHRGRRSAPGFTLIELLVVVSIIALLISILLPSLTQARKQAKSVVCLSNLKSLGGGVLTYSAEYSDRLPGPLHPALYKYQTDDAYQEWLGYDRTPWVKYLRERQLTWKLHTTLGQKSQGTRKNIADDIASCPVMNSIIPDSHFRDAADVLGYTVFPTNYVLNNVGDWLTDDSGGGATGHARVTKPMYYFGYSYPGLPPYSGDTARRIRENPPRPTSQIRRSQEEWMIADAWWRENIAVGRPGYQQDGPYQSSWSGPPYPSFAPHFKRGARAAPIDENARREVARRVRESKSDGKTNTVFFDGHASSVISKSLWDGPFLKLYGFPGTVNSREPLPDGWVWR